MLLTNGVECWNIILGGHLSNWKEKEEKKHTNEQWIVWGPRETAAKWAPNVTNIYMNIH